MIDAQKRIAVDQNGLMRFDPADGRPQPYPSHATQYRCYHGSKAWLFNPWTGDRRDARDVGSDVFGELIHTPGSLLGAHHEPLP